ncbi:MAG TPA: PspC domain-containing protein [Allosphingosinicella sp.]|jgi:phage shock protein PspC (stress-responsive transcriptional regulator)
MASSYPMARDDTLLGACYAIGEDFGFNPFYLRLVFAVALLAFPVMALTAYAALTALVTLARWLVPNPRPVGDFDMDVPDCADPECEALRLAA